MILDTIFTVKNEDLGRLSPQEAVDFFRELLWAEARRIGIPISKINVSSWINVPDGGVDASVEECNTSAQSDLIKCGPLSYQIKTGASFEPWQDARIRKELFGSKNPSKENLGSSVRDCLDKNETYVLVCFKQDLTNEQHRKAVGTLESYFKQCKYPDPKVEVWSLNNLIGFLKPYPSLALQVNGRGRANFQMHQSWSQQDDMKKDFKAGEKQKELILALRTELRRNDEAVHLRVCGEPGIGKTKLILEATNDDDLRPLSIYCDSAHKFRDSELMNEILKTDNTFSSILVIDECDPDSRSYIWNKLKHCGSRIKLVSIYSEYDDTSGNIRYFDMPPLDKEQISSIIQGYVFAKDQADRWSDICSGSPRVAHVIGWNLKNNPEDLLKSPDTVNIWERYIVGQDDPGCQEVHQRRLVLRHIALFKRFGYGRPVVAEAQAIAKMVEQADSQITWARFQEIIQNLKTRKILLGEHTLYITPKALHIKLWADWWDTYSDRFSFDEFSKNVSSTLLEWFYEMFKYARESKAASRIVEELLGENDPFQKENYLKTKLGARFFLALTEADPESALKCLKRTIGTWSKEELLKFTEGRREVVCALEMIAVWRHSFVDAARLLLALSEAENETWSNNASGVFANLFSPILPSTEVSLQERFLVLKEALESNSKEQRLLALHACDHALKTSSVSRMVGAEYQGLQKEPQLWMPKTWGEVFTAYRQVWQLLYERLDSLPEDEQQQTVNILLQHARGIGGIPNLADMVIDTVSELANKPYVDKRKVLAEIVQILHYDGKGLPVQTRCRWERLKDELTGSDFPSLMKRYVSMDLLEDKFDEQGNQVDQVQSRIEELAKQAVENNDLLQSELDWLVTAEAKNGYRFGYELGKMDKDFSLLPTLLEAQRNTSKDASGCFLGGYLRALFEKSPERWEKELDAFTEDEKLNTWIPELTWRSGASDRSALRVLNLAKRGIVGTGHLRIFCFGGMCQSLSENIFKTLVDFLLGNLDPNDIFTALDLYHLYYTRKGALHTLPEELTLKLLTHKSLFQKSVTDTQDTMGEYAWTEIGKAFVKLYPEKGLELADKMLEHLGEKGTIFYNILYSNTLTVLNEITQKYPQEVWMLVTKYLDPPMDSRVFYIKEWLRGELFGEREGMLSKIPLEKIWKWVDEDVEKRAPDLGRFIPKRLFREEGKICLVREMLVRYGQRKDVRSALEANFSSEGWSGPVSLHYIEKKQQLLEFKKGESNENVKRWIDEYVLELDRNIGQAKIEEEREGF